jgi:hypothetical protein
VHIDDPDETQIKSILKDAGVPLDLKYEFRHSYESENPPPNNDYFQLFDFYFPVLPDTQLTPSADSTKWQTGKESDCAHIKAIEYSAVGAHSYRVSWWPSSEELASDRYARYFTRTEWTLDQVNPAEFYAYDRQTRMLYFASYKH